MFIDTHAHLLKQYYPNIDETIAKTLSTVPFIFNIAFDYESSEEVLELAKKHQQLKPIIGLHPSEFPTFKAKQIHQLEKLINSDVIAIGEIGLDYHYPKYNKIAQKTAFIAQIELAKKHQLPIVIHSRDSLVDCYEIIKKYPNQKFLFHSWSGDEILTKKILKSLPNVYFSYNGIITFKNAQLQRDVLKIIPLNKLFLETDCPYLSPMPFRGQQNFPDRVSLIYQFVANELTITIEELAKQINLNVTTFFNIKLN